MDGGNWKLGHDGWDETWHCAPDGGFDRVVVGARFYAVGRDDLTPLRPRSADGCAVCRGVLPQGFAHCPACGARLSDIPGPADPCQTVPNAGQPEAGLPPLTLANAVQREAVKLPEAGRQFAFAVAGEPARLFALDRDGGWLHEFDRRRQGWTRVAGVGDTRLPGRSWSMAAGRAGLAIAGGGRLTVIDLTAGPVPRTAATTLGVRDACVGAPCLIHGEALALVTRGSVLHLARRRMVRGGEWVFAPVRDAPAQGLADPLRDAFSAPMTTQTSASWAGRAGTVVASLDDGDRMGDAVWRGWSEGFAPSLEHRPYVDPDGLVWQFGSMPNAGGKRGMGFDRVGLHNQHGRERIGGSVLASGILACRLLTLRHCAWLETSPYDRLMPGGEGDFLVPVLALDRQRCVLIRASGGLGDLVHAGAAGVGTPVLAGLCFCDGWTLHDLGLPVALRTLSQVSAFVFAGALYAYDAQDNECWRWTLQAAD